MTLDAEVEAAGVDGERNVGSGGSWAGGGGSSSTNSLRPDAFRLPRGSSSLLLLLLPLVELLPKLHALPLFFLRACLSFLENDLRLWRSVAPPTASSSSLLPDDDLEYSEPSTPNPRRAPTTFLLDLDMTDASVELLDELVFDDTDRSVTASSSSSRPLVSYRNRLLGVGRGEEGPGPL